jgi:hypothetical protein
MFHDFIGGNVKGLLHGNFTRASAASDLTETSLYWPWANGKDTNALIRKLKAEGFTKAGHISFGCGINREVGNR